MPAPRTCECMDCPKCYAREWARRRYRAKAYGQWNPHGDMAAVRAHLLELREAGMGIKAIAQAAGVGRSRVGEIITGKAQRVTHRVADALLAVTPDQRLQLPPHGVTRRLRALNALGYPTRLLAAEVGTTQEVICDHLRAERKYVLAPTDRRVRETYDRLCMTPGPSEVSAKIARRNGYAPPLAWTDIDDPDEQPTGIREGDEPDRTEVLADLIDRGADIHDALRELQIGREALRVWCSRTGRLDLYAALARRETRTA